MIGTKKDEARFTIKFNSKNPRHREAIRILNEAGKAKATLIANVFYMYTRNGGGLITDLLGMGNDNQHAIPISSNLSNTSHTATHEPTGSNQLTEDDIWQVVDESLESFFC